eukprot:TRINITY_DN46442_c0_g1_i1.p1 TRINITY_DN46442_c0_g1~~TRINITY_DN46442_c0_g1_i1.p1  ORF type:complete len:183 (+),score=17.82 TRINITY_DN46442_c0_g1_i1:43-591(+)
MGSSPSHGRVHTGCVLQTMGTARDEALFVGQDPSQHAIHSFALKKAPVELSLKDPCSESGDEDSPSAYTFGHSKSDGAIVRKYLRREDRRASCGENSFRDLEWKLYYQKRRLEMATKHDFPSREVPAVLDMNLSPLASRRNVSFGRSPSRSFEAGCGRLASEGELGEASQGEASPLGTIEQS